MPTVASMNFWRKDSRAWCWIASTVRSVPKTFAASSFVRWMAGAMRCEGCVCVSWTIRSPRSVSTTSIPSPSRSGSSSISSPAIDLTLVTTMRVPGARLVPAFQHSWPMISRASAASFARRTLPPTASTRAVNCSRSSGRRSRLAWRRRLRSALPFSKSKLSNAVLRRARRPVIACSSARCRLGSSRARFTRREKWPRLSGTRCACFFDGLRHLGWCRHRRQAYGPGTYHGALIPVRVEHGVWVRGACGARELGVFRRHLDRVGHAVEGSRKHRGHEPVLLRQRGHRLERAARAFAMGCRRIPNEDVELDQRHRRDRVLRQRLDPLAEAPQLDIFVGARAIEVATELRVAETLFDVRGQVERDRHPPITEPVLMRAKRRPHRPHLVAELSAGALGARHAFALSIGALEEGVQQLLGRLGAPGVQVSDGESRVPRGVDATVDVGSRSRRALVRVHRVVVLVRVLAARV